MQYGFVKTAALTPSIRVADCAYNARQIIEVLRGAAAAGAEIACLPELCITGYTCGDLFFQPVLQQGAQDALADVLRDTAGLPLLFVLGLPLTHGGKLYNCAAVCQNGRVPVSYTHLTLPTNREVEILVVPVTLRTKQQNDRRSVRYISNRIEDSKGEE